jgi:hypothetical protein
MFPSGSGLVHLSLAGVLPLAPEPVYTLLELLAVAGCVLWYWRNQRNYPESIGLVLAVLPLFFAWRSLTTYFYFVGLPAVLLLIACVSRHQQPQSSEMLTQVPAEPAGTWVSWLQHVRRQPSSVASREGW